MKYAIVAIDYFTKWVEAEALASITEAKTSSFIWKSIICRFGIPYAIVTDNGRQFDNENYKRMCEELGIKTFFSSPVHPQLNEHVEAVHKTIMTALKTKLSNLNRVWVDELSNVF